LQLQSPFAPQDAAQTAQRAIPTRCAMLLLKCHFRDTRSQHAKDLLGPANRSHKRRFGADSKKRQELGAAGE